MAKLPDRILEDLGVTSNEVTEDFLLLDDIRRRQREAVAAEEALANVAELIYTFGACSKAGDTIGMEVALNQLWKEELARTVAFFMEPSGEDLVVFEICKKQGDKAGMEAILMKIRQAFLDWCEEEFIAVKAKAEAAIKAKVKRLADANAARRNMAMNRRRGYRRR